MTVFRLLFAWPLLCLSVAPSAELRLEMNLSDDDVAICSPIVARVTITNEETESVRLNAPIEPEAGTLSFQVQAPGGNGFHEVPGSRTVSLVVGVNEMKGKESRQVFALLLPSKRRPFLDSEGLWLIRCKISNINGVRGESEVCRVFVRAAGDEKARDHAFEINSMISRHLVSGSKSPISYEHLIEAMSSSHVGKQTKKTLGWLAAVAKIRESTPESFAGDYRDALAQQAELDEVTKLLMATHLARRLFESEKDEEARKQLMALDEYNRRRIEYSVSEMRRERSVPATPER